uniref:Uncharacterized protein n=1 Tax=Caenorhabditis japonica TaxID=281687 RepID=A0A8R1IP23_CAEJA
MVPGAFTGESPDYHSAGKAILRAARLGLAGTLAFANYDGDTRVYATKVIDVKNSTRGTFVMLELSTCNGPAPISSWSRSSPLSMEVAEAGILSLEVKSSKMQSTTLLVTAKLTFSSNERLDDPAAVLNRNGSVWQTFDDSMHQLRTLPEPSSWNGIPPASPATQCMVAIAGGPVVALKKPNRSPVVCSQAGIILSQEQSDYVRTLTETQTAEVIANSPPGVGKSMMVAVA